MDNKLEEVVLKTIDNFQNIIDAMESNSLSLKNVYDYISLIKIRMHLINMYYCYKGILLFENEELRNLFDIKIYVDSDADERILRRILRDVEQRGRDLNGVITQYLNTVKPMHALYVEPTRQMADLVINSGFNDVAFDLICNQIKKILKESR